MNALAVMLLLCILSLISSSSANTPEVCFPSVVRHRIDSIFPTSRLLCVSKQNDDFEYGDVQIVNADEQWTEFSKSRWQQKQTDSDENLKILHFGNSTGVRLFKLPAAVSKSDFCTGTQNVEIKRNLTEMCKPLATTNIFSQCTENYFLSALALFGNGEFLGRLENETVPIPWLNTEQMRTPVWNGSMCIGVLKNANIIFHFNETHVNSVEAHIEYYDLPGNVDNNWFEQFFSIQWVQMKTESDPDTEMNRTSLGIGYKTGGQIYRVQGSVPVPFAVPTLGDCYSNSVFPSPVMFLRPMYSVCTIPTTSCEDARAKAKSFYEQVYPLELVSSPSENAHPAAVGRVNVTWEELSPSITSCRLPVLSLLQVYYSKQGSTKNYHEVIVAGNMQLLLEDVPYISGQAIRMPVSISFTDVTPPPRNVFAALPYIDIRLPHDFFYPFVSSSAHSSFYFTSIVVFSIFICFIFY